MDMGNFFRQLLDRDNLTEDELILIRMICFLLPLTEAKLGRLNFILEVLNPLDRIVNGEGK